MSFDIKCHQLARAFLADEGSYTEKDVESLAQAIQERIEDWLTERRSR